MCLLHLNHKESQEFSSFASLWFRFSLDSCLVNLQLQMKIYPWASDKDGFTLYFGLNKKTEDRALSWS